MTVQEASAAAKKLLQEHDLYNINELNTLFYAATGKERIPSLTQQLTETDESAFFSLVSRRIDGEPLQYLLGSWPFLDFEVKVDSRALIPRSETELLAETAVKLLGLTEKTCAVDLCSGTGVLAFALKRAFPLCEVYGVELSAAAYSLLCENAQLLECGIAAVHADAEAYVKQLAAESVDVFVSNPPYVTPQDYKENILELQHEPEMAFLGGEDGLYFYKSLIPACYPALKKGGYIAFEIGEEQAAAVSALLMKNGYCDISVLQDFSSLDRVVFAKKA
ncbi:MAG: peptide chain release factor N(5)-glutamine methyltransferase [Oscillospiraceae bacterium]|nr:peptide chain release factor N(5)-glutamine methyltransferase [Oscillospiraceae bacterium]